MAKQIATSKQTSGGGFIFEDKLSAWILANIVSNNIVFTEEIGPVYRIDYQVRQDGWLLDDFLLSCANENQQISRISVSAKSNTLQVNSEGFSKTLVNDLWSQFLNDESSVFDKHTDYFCIVTSPLSNDDLRNGINLLLKSAKCTDSVLSLSRISDTSDSAFSTIQKKIFNSLNCPDNLATKHNVSHEQVIDLLKRIIFLEFDYESATSKDEIALRNLCKNCLTDQSQAQQFYNSLLAVRGEFAPISGSIDYEHIVLKFNTDFSLKGFPNHLSDWNNLNQGVNKILNRIPDKIGEQVSLNREFELDELDQKFTDKSAVFVFGKSGYGKSVLSKLYAKRKIELGKKIIWIDVRCFEGTSITNYFNLQNDLTELISKVQDSECYIFIDGIDRFYTSNIVKLAEVLTEPTAKKNTWKILVSCQTDDFGDVLERLHANNISIVAEEYYLKELNYEDKQIIQNSFPKLKEIFNHEHLSVLLNNLKILDLLIFNLSKINIADSYKESEIIDIIWKHLVEIENSNSDQNSIFLQNLGEKQANELSMGIAKSSFSISDINPLSLIKKSKIVYEKNEKLYFSHDLFGDWARYKLILANDSNFKVYILQKDFASPLWCKAIRVYGIYLLDKTDDSKYWISLFNSLNDKNPKEKIIQDLLLEAVIFSSSSYLHLENLWDLFKQDNGKVLKVFLNIFQIRATKPNRQTLEWVKQINNITVSEASTIHRELLYAYWIPVLQFLYNHKDDVSELARQTISIIGQKWLNLTPLKSIYRREIAHIALINANWVFNFKLNGGFVSGDLDKEIYKTLLLGVNEFPAQVIELSLKLCRRIAFEKPIKETNEELVNRPKSLFFKSISMDPWPDGPSERIDDDFADICVNTDSLLPMISLDAAKAKEILLACFIKPPREYEQYSSFDKEYDIDDPHQWFPPFYTRGPFLNFLKLNSTEGLDFIIRLVNFTTQQWADLHKDKPAPSIMLKVSNQNRIYLGDYSLYFWFRDTGNAPHAIVSALMSLEKYLYDQLDNKIAINDIIQHILNNSNSVAFLGLLSSVGKYSSNLFLNELKCLLGNSRILFWERGLDYGAHNIEGHQMIGSDIFPRKTWEQAKEWHQMGIRKNSIVQWASHYNLNLPEMENFFKEMAENWKEELKEIEDKNNIDPFLDNLIAQFDKSNYELKEDGERPYYEYKEPQYLSEKLEKIRQSSENTRDLLSFPYSCLKALENNTQLNINDIDSIWKKIQGYVSNLDQTDNTFEGDEYDSIFGGFAILLNNKAIWQETHSEYLADITRFTSTALQNYMPDITDKQQVDIGTNWRSFVAHYLPELWAKNIKNIEYRELICLLVIKSSYDTVKTLFANIAKQVKWSDSNFVQLQNFTIEFSISLDNYRKERNRNIYNWKETSNSRYSKVLDSIKRVFRIQRPFDINKIILDFIKDKTKTKLTDWSKLRNVAPKIKHRQRHWSNQDEEDYMHQPGLDMELLYHAFDSLPLLSNELEKSTYNHIMILYDQFTEQLIFEFGDIEKDKAYSIEGFPDKSHITMIKKLVQVIPLMNEVDNPSRYWLPILKYGAAAPHWVERYCSYYILMNIDKPDRMPTFLSEWNKMIDYANKSDSWLEKNKFENSRNAREIWHSLLCISNEDIWNDDFPHFFREAANHLFNWVNNKWHDQNIIYKLTLLLRTKNSKLFIDRGIPLIKNYIDLKVKSEKVGAPEGYSVREFEHADTLARTVSYLWENQRNEIQREEQVYMMYKEIVTYLVSIQNSIALDLQQRIILN